MRDFPTHPTCAPVPLEPFGDDGPDWYDVAEPAYPSGGLDRLTHLVLVDGRLVDVWTEPVQDTRWMRFAERFDRERSLAFVEPRPLEPPKAPYDQILDWLDMLVGGLAAVDGLDGEPLAAEGLALPLDSLDIRARHRLESAAGILERAGEQFPDVEMGIVLRRALCTVWDTEPEVVLRAASSAHVAAGICWAVGKANGAFAPHGHLTQSGLGEALGLPCRLSTPGPTMRRALRGMLSAFPTSQAGRPEDCPDLLPLGRTDLLTSSTLRLLIRLRDRARAAKASHDPQPVLP
ncbi:MAG TPA: hypothetical protein VFJ19_03545 [Nocardioidaceae bacterium]|nr:hypothetical protein [Nocardioidaceae bacterium]